MLIPIDELDEANRSLCQAFCYIGLDLSNGNYMITASEPANGRNGMYILHVRNKMSIVIWAADAQGAIDKANYK